MRKTIVLSSLVIGVGVLAWWLLTPRRQQAHSSAPINLASNALTNETLPPLSAPPPSNGWSEPDIPLGPLTNKKTEDWFRKLSPAEQKYWKETSTKVMTAADTTNVPIEFWGRVVDQDGNPLEGVHIMATVRQWLPVFPASAGSRFVTNRVVTDSNGEFHLGGVRGDSLNLAEITKDGYILPERPLLITSFGYSTSEQYRPNREKPEAFRMYKLRGAEPTISYGLYDGHRGVRTDGTPVFLNLVTGQHSTEPDATADLRLSVRRAPENLATVPQGASNWTVSIAVRRGGVLQTDDIFPYWAPETGYAPQLEAVAKRNVRGNINAAKLQFYVKTRDKLYARLEFDCYLESTGELNSLWYRTYLSPSGSRNLEAVYERNINNPDEIRHIDEETSK